MEKIAITGMKCDFHIHSYASKHRESDSVVDGSTIDNINILIDKLNDRKINMCAITDHDNFDYNLYVRLKKEENIGTIKKVFPGVEFSVIYEEKVIHIITIFDNDDLKCDEKLKTLQEKIFDVKNNKPLYDNKDLNAFTEQRYLDIIREIGLNIVMIAHQKETLSSKITRTHDIKSLGEEMFEELVFLDYFESFEFRNRRNEIFNKYYIEKNKDKLKTENIRFITGSDCHDWNEYPNESDNFRFTYLKCLPNFRGLAMAITNTRRINYINSFFSNDIKFIDNLEIKINDNYYNINLSKGINVIIGDNSIGKSLLIHKLTEYRYLNNLSRQKSYEAYLSDNKMQVNTVISEDMICKFDKQGNIRSMFESKSFRANDFLKDYFPLLPNYEINKKSIKLEIDKYINFIKNKHKLKESIDKITNINLKVFDVQAKSLNTQNSSIDYTKKIENLNTVIEKIENIITDLKELIKNNSEIDKEDLKDFEKDLKKYEKLKVKYHDKIVGINFEVDKINIINSRLELLSKNLTRSKTDETKAIESYEQYKKNFRNTIVSLYSNSKLDIKYIPNIPTIKLMFNRNIIGQYRFITKAKINEVSNDYIVELIKSAIGKKYKNINDLDASNVPEKFVDKSIEESFDIIMDKIKKELYSKIEDDFSQKQLINNATDVDVTRQLSSGFNSKIYFDIISKQKEKGGIYVIDQPEDDVSQTSIKNNLLEDFVDMSQNRQIIIITHNPQFIVNLDVDNVIFLTKNENDEILLQNGALEYYDENYDILKIVAENIDGGINSINERWKRYEKNI